MSDITLDTNRYFRILKTEFKDTLCQWVEPKWAICVPLPESIPEDFKMTKLFAGSQALCLFDPSRSLYNSELFGSSLEYRIVGIDPRKIQWNEPKVDANSVSEVIIKNEYLITIEEHVVHVLLTDRLLPSMIEDDESFLTQIDSFSVTSDKLANTLLRQFRCHQPILEDLERSIEETKENLLPTCNVDQIQCNIHNLILQAWEALIKRHVPELQTNANFQDLIFKALDFFVVSCCHNELWEQITDRCSLVDQMVSTRINYLKSLELSPVQLGVSKDLCLPLPAAIVEMATLNGRPSALERLHCVRDSVELIEAQTKEAGALVCQYTDSDRNETTLSTEDLLALMVVVLIQSQCTNIVANIYYLTHYVFSVTDEAHSLWRSLRLLRNCLELIMKLNISHLPPVNHPIRKELSLQDLMQISTEVESRFESPRIREGSQSALDITALDLQLHQLTSRIHQSTQALSETILNENNSPSRQTAPPIVQTTSKVQSFLEFLSGIPSTIRASFRRRQSEQRIAFYSSINS